MRKLYFATFRDGPRLPVPLIKTIPNPLYPLIDRILPNSATLTFGIDRCEEVMAEFEEMKKNVARQLIRIFADVPYFTKLAPKIIRLLEDVPNYDFINPRTMAIAMDRYFELSGLTRKSPSAIALKKQIEIVVCCAYIMMKYNDPNVQDLLWTDRAQLHEYGFQINVETEEQIYLLNFRNYMIIALMLLPPEENKKLLLDVCSRLEGRDTYIERHTGGGQTNDVRRRMQIYYLENNLPIPESAVILRDQQSHRKTKSTSSIPQPTAEELIAIDNEPTPLLTFHQLEHIRDHLDNPLVPLFNNAVSEMSEDDLQTIANMIHELHRLFSDFLHFDLLMTRPLKQHLSELKRIHTECIAFSEDSISVDPEVYVTQVKVSREREILSEFHSFKIFDSNDLRQIWKMMEVIMRTATVYFLSQEPAIQERFFIFDANILTARYTSFTVESGVHGAELTYLVAFRNAVKLELVLDQKKEKVMALQVGERLEGAHRSYVLGSKASAGTRRRIEIYEREGGNAPKKRTAHSYGAMAGDVDFNHHPHYQPVVGDRLPRFEQLRNMQQQHDEMIDVANALMSIRAPEPVHQQQTQQQKDNKKTQKKRKLNEDDDDSNEESEESDDDKDGEGEEGSDNTDQLRGASAMLPEAPSAVDDTDNKKMGFPAPATKQPQPTLPEPHKGLTSENMLDGKLITRNELDGSAARRRNLLTVVKPQQAL